MRRGWMAPLIPLYAAGLAAKNAAYDRGWLKAQRLRWPVVSIGNLSVGGAGKTPLTIRLAELLKAEGVAVDVLSRGYGRTATATERVDAAGVAARYGDEPLLIARRADAPVYVGASRYEAGLLAESELRSSAAKANLRSIHLLDDGFQHRNLARDVDIVVLHRSDFSESLLPAGRLREPLAALRRADFIVLREEDAELESELRQLDIAAPIWWMRRAIALSPATWSRPEGQKVERVVAFCGLARPEEFFATLKNAGVSVAARMAFLDHQRYTSDHMRRLAKVHADAQADAFVTTEKDAVKLDTALLRMLETAAPVRVARLTVSLRDEDAVRRQLLSKLFSK